MRKPPLSVHSKKIANDPPPTPMRVPSQIRGWNQDSMDDAGPGGDATSRPQSKAHILGSPKAHRAHKSPEKARKSAMLPGFQNSFINSSPVRPSQPLFDKGRGRANDVWNGSGKGKQTVQAPSTAYETHLASSDPPPISPPCSPTRVKQRTQDIDIRMADVVAVRNENRVVEIDFARDLIFEDGDVEMMNEEDGPFLEKLDQIEALDWKQEVSFLLA